MRLYRVAAVLVIALLAGPVADVACDVWCVTELHGGMPAEACHHSHAVTTQTTVRAATETCERVSAAGPFLPEVVYRALPSAAASPLAGVVPATLPTRHPNVRSLLPAFECRHPGNAPSVLRI